MLGFDPESGRLVSWRPRHAPEQQFLAAEDSHPVFVIQYLSSVSRGRAYSRLDSFDAAGTNIQYEELSEGQLLRLQFTGIDGLELSLTAEVRASADDPMSRWSISLNNGAGLEVVDLQFPFIVAARTPGGSRAGETVLLPFRSGQLRTGPHMDDLKNDEPAEWEFRPENGDANHYPGRVFAQFIAYYNDLAGIYLACDDTDGNVKLFKALRRELGVRLGVAPRRFSPAGIRCIARRFQGRLVCSGGDLPQLESATEVGDAPA